MNYPTKFGSTWPSDFREEDQKHRQLPFGHWWASCFCCVLPINKKST